MSLNLPHTTEKAAAAGARGSASTRSGFAGATPANLFKHLWGCVGALLACAFVVGVAFAINHHTGTGHAFGGWPALLIVPSAAGLGYLLGRAAK